MEIHLVMSWWKSLSYLYLWVFLALKLFLSLEAPISIFSSVTVPLFTRGSLFFFHQNKLKPWQLKRTAAGCVWFVSKRCDRAHSCSCWCQRLSGLHAAFLAVFFWGIGVENANLFHKAITSHHDIEPTSLQCPPMLAVKMSDESFSSGGNPIWFTLLFFLRWGACLHRAVFHLNIKACEEVVKHFEFNFRGSL